jgi:hypothetical protein
MRFGSCAGAWTRSRRALCIKSSASPSFYKSLKEVAQTFLTGTKFLLLDSRLMLSIGARYTRHGLSGLSRQEYRHMTGVARDLCKVLPIVVFFAVPLIGNIGPFIAFKNPKVRSINGSCFYMNQSMHLCI